MNSFHSLWHVPEVPSIINEGSDDIDTAHLPKVITKYFLNLIKCFKFIFLDLCIENSIDLCGVFFSSKDNISLIFLELVTDEKLKINFEKAAPLASF